MDHDESILTSKTHRPNLGQETPLGNLASATEDSPTRRRSGQHADGGPNPLGANGASKGRGLPGCREGGLFDSLFAQAERDEELIGKMASAVKLGDKELVFRLAEELT